MPGEKAQCREQLPSQKWGLWGQTCPDYRVRNQLNHHTATGRTERSEVTERQEESSREALAGASEGRTVSVRLPINTLLQVGSATSTVRATLRQSEPEAHSLPASILGQEQNSYLCSWKGSELIFFSKEQRKQMFKKIQLSVCQAPKLNSLQCCYVPANPP